jgi:hypothetical protein
MGRDRVDDRLVAVARRILGGGEVPEVDFRSDFKPPDFEKAPKHANDLWLACRMFQDDEDIRAREPDYDKKLREAVVWHLQKYFDALGDDR